MQPFLCTHYADGIHSVDELTVTCSSDDLPDVINGSFSCSNPVNVGDVCNLTCIENYYPSLLSQTTCMNVGTEVANWSNVTELLCSVNTCSFEDLPDVTSGVFDQSKCSGQNIDAVCNVSCSPGLYPDSSDATVCRSVDGKKAEWMVKNVYECKDYWSETMMACIRDHNDLEITNTDNIEVCKDLCMQEHSITCLSVDFISNRCYMSSRNRHNIELADDFVVPCYIIGAVYAERIDIASWSSEVNTCLDGLGNLWSGSLIDLDSCKLICSQTIDCCSLMFKNGLCHLSKSQKDILPASFPNDTTPSDGCNWVYTERIDKTCPIE
ncbi:hypothetical protein HOLleu_40239 [Holothuria leucospilota]|uniref:Uncharacterized protein n=1 Tax=Holothuria leucospilota TaxID=206669 RepID=A0A9Q0YEY7_HOLLE|nr:hypothetical protein HOLleu_40239 [Holothuria leucospilota]